MDGGAPSPRPSPCHLHAAVGGEIALPTFIDSPKLFLSHLRSDLTRAINQRPHLILPAVAGSSSPGQVMLAMVYWESEGNIITETLLWADIMLGLYCLFNLLNP